MTDLKRLRLLAASLGHEGTQRQLVNDAADEIERLREDPRDALIRRLKEIIYQYVDAMDVAPEDADFVDRVISEFLASEPTK